MARGETVQCGALRTFPLDHSIKAVQVTITTDGLPMNVKVELLSTSSHVKQLAEIDNDNGQTRPFTAIVYVPGGSNTIAVYKTGPMECPVPWNILSRWWSSLLQGWVVGRRVLVVISLLGMV